MKILISAYACEPDRGSEPYLGWRWSREIASHHEVWIITRSNNKDAIKQYLEKNPNPNMHFCYVDLGCVWRKIKKLPLGLKVYYHFWQKAAYKAAKKLNKQENFDIVHHLTFGALTQPTYMWNLGMPFIWGPLGGGEKMPQIKGRHMDLISRMYEKVRAWQIAIHPYLPFTQNAFKKAKYILTTTQETANLVPRKYQEKVVLFQSLGIDSEFMKKKIARTRDDSRIKILMVGRMIGWKGFDIGIDAFIKLAREYDNVDLYLRGNGENKATLLAQCGDLLNNRIFYVDKFFNYEDMYAFYQSHDIFLNCTLHDSGCLAMLEAMSASLPIVCIDTGGPHVISTEKNAFKIKPTNYEELVNNICEALETLVLDNCLRHNMGEESKRLIEEQFMYEKKYEVIDSLYKSSTRSYAAL